MGVARGAEIDADAALEALYAAHYRPLVRLATFLLGGDIGAAEDAVQDAFVAVHSAWRRLRDPSAAVAYLRTTVVNRCRSVQRHLVVVDRFAPERLDDAPSAEASALHDLDADALVAALRALPPRQREALVLRYYGGLSEAEIAEAMGVSRGAVKTHASRGLAALRTTLESLR